ncbi:MAG: hypothetical protein KDD35_05275 [Bdellovibrionales bacterium]|nr:hypothetical protein [Bdellovibrionales bacterium]
MDKKIEVEINQLLNRWSNSEKVAEILAERLLDDEKLSTSNEISIMNFLFLSGHFKELVSPMLRRLKNKGPVAWSVFVETLNRNKLKPSRKVLNALFEGALKSQRLENLILAHAWDEYDSRFETLRDELRERLKEEFAHKKKVLFDKLSYLANHRMLKEEEKVLELLLRMFPTDRQIQAHQIDFQDRWARNILATSSQNRLISQRTHQFQQNWTEPEIKLMDLWFSELEKIARTNPPTAYLFAVFFIFAEAWEYALKILKMAPSSKNVDWLRLNLLLQCRHFVECLSELDKVELENSDDPESSFSAAYIRAKAFYGLGQRSTAMEILRHILEIKPDYRSAQTLLAEWARGDI